MADLRAPFSLEPAQSRTRLVLVPTDSPALTRFCECDSRSSVARGIMEYIQDLRVQAVGGRYLTIASANETWAQAEQQAQYPAIAVVPEGEGEYQATTLTSSLDPKARIPQPDGRWVSIRGTFSQVLRVELYTNDPRSRTAISAAIEQAFAPVDWMYGFRLVLPHYFNAVARYEPLNISYPDTAETALERLRTVVYHVRADVSLIALRGYPLLKPELVEKVVLSSDVGEASPTVVPSA